MTDNFLRNIADATIDTKSPVSEDLMTRVRDNLSLLNSVVASISNGSLQGAADSITTGVIVDADPTAGAINHDDKFNGLYVHFTSGTLYTTNNLNRYKITDTDSAGNSITVAEDLAAAGGAATDTYIVLGHTHDGDATHPDGASIDLKHTINMIQDQVVGQDVADAITDPNSFRAGTANATTPFITGSDVANRVEYDTLTSATNDFLADATTAFTKIAETINDDSGVDYHLTASLTGIVPAGTKRCRIRIQVGQAGGSSSPGTSRVDLWNVHSSGVGFVDRQAFMEYDHDGAGNIAPAGGGVSFSAANGTVGSVYEWDVAVDNNLDVKFTVYKNFGGTTAKHSFYITQWPVA